MVLAIDSDGNSYLFKNIASCSRNLDILTRSANKVAAGKQNTVSGYRIIKLKTFEDRRNWEDAE